MTGVNDLMVFIDTFLLKIIHDTHYCLITVRVRVCVCVCMRECLYLFASLHPNMFLFQTCDVEPLYFDVSV